jgi:hypothetical protein
MHYEIYSGIHSYILLVQVSFFLQYAVAIYSFIQT